MLTYFVLGIALVFLVVLFSASARPMHRPVPVRVEHRKPALQSRRRYY